MSAPSTSFLPLAGPSLPGFPVERCKGNEGLKARGERTRSEKRCKGLFVSAFPRERAQRSLWALPSQKWMQGIPKRRLSFFCEQSVRVGALFLYPYEFNYHFGNQKGINMKRYLLVGICTLLFSACINAPASKSGKDHVISTEQLPVHILTEYTCEDMEGKLHPIWLQKGKAGKWRAYVNKVSKRGKDYKYFLNFSTEDLARIVNDTVNNEEKN